MKILFTLIVAVSLFATANCYLEDVNNAVNSNPTITASYAWWNNWMIAII